MNKEKNFILGREYFNDIIITELFKLDVEGWRLCFSFLRRLF